MLNGISRCSPTSARPLNNENVFGFDALGAIGAHVHCHSARHFVAIEFSELEFSELESNSHRISGTHADASFEVRLKRTSKEKARR